MRLSASRTAVNTSSGLQITGAECQFHRPLMPLSARRQAHAIAALRASGDARYWRDPLSHADLAASRARRNLRYVLLLSPQR